MNQEKVKLLKEKGDKLEKLKEQFRDKREAFEAENAALIKEIQIVDDSMNSTKNEVKADAIEDFKQNRQMLTDQKLRILWNLTGTDPALKIRQKMQVSIKIRLDSFGIVSLI